MLFLIARLTVALIGLYHKSIVIFGSGSSPGLVDARPVAGWGVGDPSQHLRQLF